MYQVPTSDPAAEYDCLSVILQREELLKRIHASSRLDYLLYDLYREVTLQVVENLQRYEDAQLQPSSEKTPLLWNGEPYLTKIWNDTPSSEAVEEWLRFPTLHNPFLVPLDILEPSLSLPSDAFVEFGFPPPLPPVVIPSQSSVQSKLTSPYLTPVTNDIEILTTAYAIKRLSKMEQAQRRQTLQQIQKGLRTRGVGYTVFLSYDEVQRIRRCWSYMKPSFTMESFQNCEREVQRSSPTIGGAVQTQPMIEPNEELRLEPLSSVSRTWTAHEVHLKTFYSRRIGELFQLTAAATQGRLIAPTRPPRLTRLVHDLRLATQQLEALKSEGGGDVEMLRCVARQHTSLAYLSKVYDEVTAKPLLDIHAERERMTLPEGQTLVDDHYAAMALEDSMAVKIQRRARVRFGKQFLRLSKRQQIAAATAIQKSWRRHAVRHMTER